MEKKQKRKSPFTVEALKKQLTETEKLRDEYLNGWQRCKADFENHRKDDAEKIKDMTEFVKADLLLQALQVYDNLQIAKGHIPDDIKNNQWAKGILQIESQFKDFLENSGVEKIETENKQFNPELHEAIEGIEQNDQENGTIIKTIQEGYRLNGQVIRPAKVKISK